MQATVQPISICPQHRDAVLKGLREQWPEEYKDDDPLLDTLVLTTGGTPVGAVSVLSEVCSPEPPETWVAALWVHPKHRRKGLATRLLTEAVVWSPHRPLYLWTEERILHETLFALGWVCVEDGRERQVFMWR
mgnify:CR=1 FL=1